MKFPFIRQIQKGPLTVLFYPVSGPFHSFIFF